MIQNIWFSPVAAGAAVLPELELLLLLLDYAFLNCLNLKVLLALLVLILFSWYSNFGQIWS